MAEKIKFSELQNITTVAQKPLSAGEVASQALTNLPTSAIQYGKDIVTPLLDPIGTVKSIKDLGLGLIQLAIPGEQANEAQARAVGQYFANRYGGLENIKKTIAKDPVGFLGDVSIIFTGGGALTSKLGKLKKSDLMQEAGEKNLIQKVGEKTQAFGQAIDPITGLPTRKIIGLPLAEILSTTTGVGREAFEEAYKAGATGGQKSKEFKGALRGKTELEDIVAEGKEGVSVMADKRKSEYLSSMEGIKASTKKINFDPIVSKMNEVRKGFEFKGETLLDASGFNKLKQIEDVIETWAKNKEFHTVEGLDALKKKIDNLYPEGEVFGKTSGKGAAVVEQMRDFVNTQIKNVSPEYAKTMQAYEQAINLEKEIRKSLSLGDTATVDSSLRKLLSVMRNNASTNFGQRLNTLKKLEEGGDISLMPQLAGTSLYQLTPRGLQRPFLGAGLGAGIGLGSGISPAYLAALGLYSPRITGELSYLAGKTLPKTGAIRQAGILSEQAGQDSMNQTLEFLANLYK